MQFRHALSPFLLRALESGRIGFALPSYLHNFGPHEFIFRARDAPPGRRLVRKRRPEPGTRVRSLLGSYPHTETEIYRLVRRSRNDR